GSTGCSGLARCWVRQTQFIVELGLGFGVGQVQGLHGRRQRHDQRQVVQRGLVAGHAGGRGRQLEHLDQVPAVLHHVGLRQEHHHVRKREVRDHRYRRLPDGRGDSVRCPGQPGTSDGSSPNVAAHETIANTFITHGADITFPVAGGVGLGTAKAVQTADQSGKNIAMFWVDTDGCLSEPTYCKYFITTVEKGLSAAVKASVLLAAKGHAGGSYVGTLANGGAVLAPYRSWASKVPASLQSELSTLKQDIISGKIVPATKS